MATTEVWHLISRSFSSEYVQAPECSANTERTCGAASSLWMPPVKRVFDIAFSACALVALIPLFAIVALIIKLDSAGPVFYVAKRTGRKGRIFCCVKFRTLTANGEKRITRAGHFLRKYSLDELPQFWNVLKGEMSIVGPRPPLGGETGERNVSHLRRFDLIPGMMGLWQIQEVQAPSFTSYVSMDAAYVGNWSVWLDLKMILRTICEAPAGTGE